eukprot:1009239-Prymnesium_polylepis.1
MATARNVRTKAADARVRWRTRPRGRGVKAPRPKSKPPKIEADTVGDVRWCIAHVTCEQRRKVARKLANLSLRNKRCE